MKFFHILFTICLYLGLFIDYPLIEAQCISIEPHPDNYPGFYLWNQSSHKWQRHCLELPDTARSVQPNFLTAPPTEKFVTHSQVGQDFLIMTLFDDMSNGYFIDLAANEWKRLSNTYALEYFNRWNGICIEPNPVYLKGLLSNRKCTIINNPVSYTTGENVTFHFGDVFSGIVGEEFDNTEKKPGDQTLTTVTLLQILDFVKAPRLIHYLSLDVEGAEYAALKGFDFEKYTIYAMTVERPKLKLHSLLLRKGFVFVLLFSTFGECLYLHHSFPKIDEMYKKHHQDTDGSWNDNAHEHKTHEYINALKWNGNIDDYMRAAEKFYEEHHHLSN